MGTPYLRAVRSLQDNKKGGGLKFFIKMGFGKKEGSSKKVELSDFNVLSTK